MENKQKLKAIGIPLTDDCNNCFGVVISEEGQVLGWHTSSSWSWLERYLASKEGLQDYEFIFTNEKPTLIDLFNLMNQVNTVLKEKLEIAVSDFNAKSEAYDQLVESYKNLQKQLSVDFQYQEIERLKSELSVAESKIVELQNSVAYCENT